MIDNIENRPEHEASALDSDRVASFASTALENGGSKSAESSAALEGDPGNMSRINIGRSDSKPANRSLGQKSQLAERLAVLPTLGVSQLRLEWQRLYRSEPPRVSRDIIMRAIAYRLQEIAFGGLSKATQRRLGDFADESGADEQSVIPVSQKPTPGSRLVREWHGRTYTVLVTDDGFEFEGKTYRSLTRIAFEITGAQWSGPRFFGLTKSSARMAGELPGGMQAEQQEAANG